MLQRARILAAMNQDEASAPEGLDLARLLFQWANEGNKVTDSLIYACYRYNRQRAPDIAPERWAMVFSDAAQMEARFQEEMHQYYILTVNILKRYK